MSMVTRFWAFVGSVMLLSAGAVGSARADYVDPPTRVARLSYASGEVSFSPAGETDWVAATRNRPLIRGDRLWADRDARAEFEIGTAAFRIDEGSSLRILSLDDRTAQVELTQGTLNLHVRRIYKDQIYEVDTPTLAFVVSRPGEYRIDVDSRGRHTTVAVWDGSGEAYGEKASFPIRDGEAIRFYDEDLSDYEAYDLPQPDDFDRFCLDRNRRMDRSQSLRYVSEDLIGYSDLDDYGSWSDNSEYGSVWFPTRVEADWAPYQRGHWIWQEPWGWTWVDEAAWGFAPFHYGRWVHVSNRWGWIPGPTRVRPVYAPALVAFVGGGGFSVGVSVGRPIGWFPLGPREVYLPPYRASRGYFTNVNITNTVINNTIIINNYDNYSRGRHDRAINYYNRNIPGAVTAVSGDAFVNGRPVRQNRIAMDRETAVRGEVAQIAALTPVSRSVRGAAPAASVTPPREAFERTVVARTAPAPMPTSFKQRERELQRTPGRPLDSEAVDNLRRQGGEGGFAGAPPRVRVVGDSPRTNARSVDAGRGAPGEARAPRRGPDALPGDVAQDRKPRSMEGGAIAPRNGAPIDRDRGRGAPPDRDFTRPDLREQDAPRVRGVPREDIGRQRVAPVEQTVPRGRDRGEPAADVPVVERKPRIDRQPIDERPREIDRPPQRQRRIENQEVIEQPREIEQPPQRPRRIEREEPAYAPPPQEVEKPRMRERREEIPQEQPRRIEREQPRFDPPPPQPMPQPVQQRRAPVEQTTPPPPAKDTEQRDERRRARDKDGDGEPDERKRGGNR